MNMETLVEEIAKEVYARLYKKLEQQEDGKQRAVIISQNKDEALERMLCEQYKVMYHEPQMRNCDLVIIPEMCVKLLANLANGLANEAAERFIMTMLLKGRKVVVLEEGLLYRRFKKVAPVMVYKLYEDYEEKLRSFGIKFVSRDNVLKSCGTSMIPMAAAEPVKEKNVQEPGQLTEDDPVCAEIRYKKLITEADLRKLHMKNLTEIVIGSKSILTPLANDFIRTQRIKVRRV
ncbi:flavoprotein [Brevibacillus ginsengisoli]|uniref:flavoprotein n=1 Tax=Brevibacillus ginsengisoli TaxID=363854 RepID=UPI003CEE1C0A